MASRSGNQNEVGPASVSLKITQVEKELLLKACIKYRYTIPAYLKSKQLEADALESVIKKLQ